MGESEGQPPWAASEQPWKRGIHVDRRTKRERQRRKADPKEYACFGQSLLYNIKSHSINLMEQAFLPDLMIRLKKDGVGRGGVSQSDPGLFPFHSQALSNKATR